MRTLSLNLQTEVARDITTPFAVVEITTNAATVLRFSSRETVTWNAVTWTESGIKVDSLRDLPGGAQEGRLVFQNFDNAASALVLTDGITDAPVKVYLLYGAGPTFAAGDGVQIFEGVCDASDVQLERVTIDITSAGRLRETSPRLYYTSFCHYMPPAGRVLSWGGEHFELISRNG